MHSDTALLDPLVGPPVGPIAVHVASPGLRLTVAGVAWSLPTVCVRAITEAGPVTALPLADCPVEGLAVVEGRPVTLIDPARQLAGTPGSGGVFVVIATGAGELALRVEDARWAGETDAPPFDHAGLPPWAGDPVPVAAVPRTIRRAAATLALLQVRDGTEDVALRIDRLERIDRPDWSNPVPESRDSLIGLDETLLTARSLSPSGAGPVPHALVLRGDAPGERAALLVDRALTVERCPPDRLTAVRHSDGGTSVWWRRVEGVPLRVIDPGPLFGWTPCADADPSADPTARPGLGGAGRPGVLVVEIAGHAVALPLALVGPVEENDAGGVRLRLAGTRRCLRVDRVRPLEAGPSDWRRLTALPPAAALLFDAARWDAAAERWEYRANADTLTQLPGKRVAWAAKRAVAAAWRGWGDGLDADRRPCPATTSKPPVTASP